MLIGLTGHAGAGKTMLMEYLSKKYDAEEYMMSRPIKEIAVAMGFPRNDVYGTQADKAKLNSAWNISAREFMQKFGTEIGRNLFPTIFPDMNLGKHKSVWLQAFANYCATISDKNKMLIVSDVRFLNEVETLQENNGYIFRINRDLSDNIKHTHQSELEIDAIKADIYLDNNGSKDDLFNTVSRIIDTLSIIGILN